MKKLLKPLVYLFVLLTSILLFSCATNNVETKTQKEPPVVGYPVPTKNLPELVNTKELSFVPQQTDYEKIYVKLFLPEKPEENLVDIYIYDKDKKKFVCCLKNCYFDTVQQENFTGLGVLWSTWAKQNAYYLIDISKYALLDAQGNEY